MAETNRLMFNRDVIEEIPQEVLEAFANLTDVCKKHNMPRSLIYDGVAWNIEGLISERVSKWLYRG